jgi:Zn2+/Cd2+-exporting ATPase
MPMAGDKSTGASGRCLVRTVAEAMEREPGLEAVKFDRQSHSVALATIGKPAGDIERFVTENIRELSESHDQPRCCLLDGEKNCDRCLLPTDPSLRQQLDIQHSETVTTISRKTCPTAPRFWRWKSIPLPIFVPREVHIDHDEAHIDEWKWQLAAALLCGALGLTAFFLKGSAASMVLFALSYLAGAWFVVEEIWEGLQERKLDVHFLMLAVAVGSASIGGWAEGSALLFLFSFSGALEHYAMGRTQREISALFKAAPKEAIVLQNGIERIVPVADLQPGMRLLIKPGDQFPVDAEVVQGNTASDESNLSGEATPVEKSIGDTVLAGTINLWGSVEVLVVRPAAESALQKIIRLIKEAQHLKAPSQRFTDRFGTGYTYAILGLTAVMFFVWWLGMKLPPFVSTTSQTSAFYKAMTLLVVASPCALVLSIPSAVLAAIAWSARRGVLFRGGAAVENLANVRVVAMDKTGTLTTGELKVERVESFPPGREHDVASLAYSLEKLSTHPLARAVTRHGKHEGLPVMAFERFESVTGLGLQALWNGKRVKLGRREWVIERRNDIVSGSEPGVAEVWLSVDGLIGRVTLRDDVRPQARDVVDQMREEGLYTVVLTGDRQAAAEHLRTALHVDDVRAELKPEEKVTAIREFTAKGTRVAMIGDGVNDAPSLAVADVGVAMGARGSDAALEQAEIVLMHDRLENFLTAFRLSRRARAIIKQNLIISLGTVVVLVTCALFGAIPLTVGVIGHEGSTVIVVANSLRLLLRRRA